MADVPDTARLVLSVKPARDRESIPAVTLAGDRNGLEWLAGHLLRVARSGTAANDSADLDPDTSAPVLQSDGWRLTVMRIDELRGAPDAEPGASADGGA